MVLHVCNLSTWELKVNSRSGQPGLYIKTLCQKRKRKKEGKERKESNAKEYMKCSSNKQLLKLGIKKIAYSSTTLETVTEYKFKVNSKMED